MSETKIRVCILSGSFNFRKETLDKIKTCLGKFDLYVFNKDEFNAQYIEQQILSINLFGGRRLVILDHIPVFGSSGAKSKNRVKDMLFSVPEGCVVVINGIEKGKRTEWIFNYVKDIGKVYCSPTHLSKANALKYVRKSLEKHDKQVEDGTEDFLINFIGETYKKGVNVDKLYLSLKKLYTFIGDQKNVTKHDVLRTVSHSREYIIWDLFDHMDKRDYNGCFNIYQKIRSLTNSERESAEQILNIILWRYRLVLFLMEAKKYIENDDDILKKLKDLKKLKRSGSGFYSTFEYDEDKPQYSEGMAGTVLKGNYMVGPVISKYSLREIYNILVSVNESLLKIRLGCNDAEIMLMVDNVFMTACNMLNSKILSLLRVNDYAK